ERGEGRGKRAACRGGRPSPGGRGGRMGEGTGVRAQRHGLRERFNHEGGSMRRRDEGPQSPFTRRDLLKAGAVAGALGAAGSLRPLPAEAASTAPTEAPAASGGAFELEELTIAELQAGLASGRWTARSLAEAYLARIAALDRQGPALHAVL